MGRKSNKDAECGGDQGIEEPMESRHFEIAVKDLNFKHAALLDATRAVMVDGLKLTEAAHTYGVTQPTITNSIKRVRKSFEAWCKSHKLILTTHLMYAEDEQIINRLEKRTLTPILEAESAKVAKRKPRTD